MQALLTESEALEMYNYYVQLVSLGSLNHPNFVVGKSIGWTPKEPSWIYTLLRLEELMVMSAFKKMSCIKDRITEYNHLKVKPQLKTKIFSV